MSKLRKIAIVGPESSGKSWLTHQLANHFQSSSCEEFARNFLSKLGRPYKQDDLIAIAKGQIELEELSISKASKIVFFDTNLLTIMIWSQIKYGEVATELTRLHEGRVYDHYLLLAPDLPYENDSLRESPSLEKRDQIFNTHLQFLKSEKASYTIIEGNGELRLKNAINALQSKFN